jgi:hypothetical protein
MEHVNNKVSQFLSKHKGVVSWLKNWLVHVAEDVKSLTPIPYMLSGICEGGVQP